MESIKNIFIPAISAMISTLVTLYIFFKNRNVNLARERLEKVFQPLYAILEPFLFKLSQEQQFINAMNETKDFINKNRLLIGNKIYENFNTFNKSNTEKEESYFTFSNSFVIEYNSLCRKVGLPRISIIYRVNNRMCDKKYLVRFFIVASLIGLLILVFGLALFCLFMYVLTLFVKY